MGIGVVYCCGSVEVGEGVVVPFEVEEDSRPGGEVGRWDGGGVLADRFRHVDVGKSVPAEVLPAVSTGGVGSGELNLEEDRVGEAVRSLEVWVSVGAGVLRREFKNVLPLCH